MIFVTGHTKRPTEGHFDTADKRETESKVTGKLELLSQGAVDQAL